MNRIVILGPGGAGKSTLAQRLAKLHELPVFELDQLFWTPGLRPSTRAEWMRIQRQFVSLDRWIIDGDLGPYDTDLHLRLTAADTVIVLDYALWRCCWQSLRRGRETGEFWRWLVRYRRDCLPRINSALAAHAGDAKVHVLRNPSELDQFVASA